MIRMKPIFNIGRLSGTDCIEPTRKSSEVYKSVIHSYAGEVSPVRRPSINTINACSVIAGDTPILAIDKLCGMAKIAPSIVRLDSVNMIYATGGEDSLHIQECKTMCPVSDSAYLKGLVALIGMPSTLRVAIQACKNASLMTIIQDRFKVFLSQLHDALRGVVELVGTGYSQCSRHYITGVYP